MTIVSVRNKSVPSPQIFVPMPFHVAWCFRITAKVQRSLSSEKALSRYLWDFELFA